MVYKCSQCGKPPEEDFISIVNGEYHNTYFMLINNIIYYFCSPYCCLKKCKYK